MDFNFEVQGPKRSSAIWHDQPISEEQTKITEAPPVETQEISFVLKNPTAKKTQNRTDAVAYKRFFHDADPPLPSLSLNPSYVFNTWDKLVSAKELNLYSKYVRFEYHRIGKEIKVEHDAEERAEHWAHLEDNFSRLLADIKAKQSSL